MKTSRDDSAAADGRPAPRPFFREGMRTWQDRFDSRRLADRLEERLGRARFTADDRAFIESRTMFFLATADEAGRPDCSYKGGDAGVVRVTGDDELVFPGYDGNGMFRSIGNLSTQAPVGLLFIDFEQPRRLRVNGLASVQPDDLLRDEFTGALLIVRVHATHIFPNCPRYIHRMQLAEPSPYVPRPGVEPPVPAWKQFEMFSDVLPRERGGGSGCEGGNSAGGGGGEPGCADYDYAMAFEIASPNSIVDDKGCVLTRVGAPAANAAANATALPGSARAGAASSSTPPAAGATPKSSTALQVVGTAGVVFDGAAFRCGDGSLLHVSQCQGNADDATCKLTELHRPGLQMGKPARRADIAAHVNGCEAGGIRYGADDKPVFVR